MQILLTGSTGLIGSALRTHWQGQHELHLIDRQSGTRRWGSPLALEQLPALDAVVHLAGAGIADKRWSEMRKRAILDSRIATTRQLVNELLALEHRPAVVFVASAIGYYGDRGNELLDEQSSNDVNFSSQLCQAWEACCAPLKEAGIRVVHLRFGIVLSANGGALGKMLPAFKAGAGGRIGSGLQWMSWIAIDDVCAAIDFVLPRTEMSGAINLTSPNPVQNRDFAKTLAKTLHRPCLLPMPAIAIKLLFGEMGEELLLGGARVQPGVLQQQGFEFQYPDLPQALQAYVGTK
ncbi:MAG: TIGR01777 family oxidoreductase [Granulosicoccaceae bacterium]